MHQEISTFKQGMAQEIQTPNNQIAVLERQSQGVQNNGNTSGLDEAVTFIIRNLPK